MQKKLSEVEIGSFFRDSDGDLFVKMAHNPSLEEDRIVYVPDVYKYEPENVDQTEVEE